MTFETEAEAKDFARAKFHEGLMVYAGTINPYSPKKLISSRKLPHWLGETQEQPGEDRDDGADNER
jgi:hypothetical protein